jgi:type VI protein secretion system component VasK
MGWLAAALVALLALGLLAVALPEVFGPVMAGLAPLLLVVAIIGLGGLWWRHGRRRVDAEATDESDEPAAEEVSGEDERVET